MKRRHHPIQPPQFKHPSGRPVPRERRGVLSMRNEPPDEPLTPGLRRCELPEAIGFTAGLIQEYSDDEWDETRETE